MKIKIIPVLLCTVLINQNAITFANEAEFNTSIVFEDRASYSLWAEESIKNSIELGLVPENLQSDYTAKITRREFCQLAVQTYIAKTGNEIDMSVKTPFTDVDDAYITTAYNLKIVSGAGNNKFAPNNYITRQEAAVMINNLATVLNIDNNSPHSEKFVDENYFADWAKSAIYSVTGIKSGDSYVMTGTGNGKFSPWMNYTREQAIATMWRLYNCDEKELFYDGQYRQSTDDAEKIYGDWLYYNIRKTSDTYDIVRLKKDGSERQVLASDLIAGHIWRIDGEFIYYPCYDSEDDYYKNINQKVYRMKLDGSNKEVVNNLLKYIPAIKTPHNEKYMFSIESIIEKPGGNYLAISNLDGSEKRKIAGNNFLGVSCILYDNYIYAVMLNDNGENIVKVDFDGNVESLVSFDYNEQVDLIILKIDDDLIYYQLCPKSPQNKPNNSDLIYSINIDGTENKLVY